jgi:hypothetical protein
MRTIKFNVSEEEFKAYSFLSGEPRNFVFAINDYSGYISHFRMFMINKPMRKMNSEFIEKNRPLIEIWNNYHPKNKILL